MLRITDNMTHLSSQRDLARAQYGLALRQRRVSSGLRVERPSDDPCAAAGLVRLQAERQDLDQCQENISRATSTLQASDQVLGSINDLLIRARELATAMASDSYVSVERASAAEEITALRNQLMALANTRQDGEYILGGYQTDAAPVDATGAVVGDDSTRMVLAAPALEVAASISAAEALSPGNGQDVIAVLDTLSADLAANDTAGIRTAVGALEQCQEQVNGARALAGVRLSALLDLEQINESRAVTLAGEHARVAEVDVVEGLTDLARAQRTVESALQVTARVLSNLSLVDKL